MSWGLTAYALALVDATSSSRLLRWLWDRRDTSALPEPVEVRGTGTTWAARVRARRVSSTLCGGGNL